MNIVLSVGSVGGLIVAIVAVYFAEPPNVAWARGVAITGAVMMVVCGHLLEKRRRAST